MRSSVSLYVRPYNSFEISTECTPGKRRRVSDCTLWSLLINVELLNSRQYQRINRKKSEHAVSLVFPQSGKEFELDVTPGVTNNSICRLSKRVDLFVRSLAEVAKHKEVRTNCREYMPKLRWQQVSSTSIKIFRKSSWSELKADGTNN